MVREDGQGASSAWLAAVGKICRILGSKNCDRIPNHRFSGFLTEADWCKCHLLKAKEVAAANYIAMNPH